MNPTFDDIDAKILSRNMASLDKNQGPRCGDYVVFADGVTRRVSHIWDFQGGSPVMLQTSDGGSWCLGDGYVSFSGTLYRSV